MRITQLIVNINDRNDLKILKSRGFKDLNETLKQNGRASQKKKKYVYPREVQLDARECTATCYDN